MVKRTRDTVRLNPDRSVIAIIGGGISGLATVLQILVDQQREYKAACADGSTGTGSCSSSTGQRLCRTIRIYDKRPESCTSNDGYGLTISYQPYGILHNMGILDAVTEEDCPSRSHYICQADGTIVGYFGNAFSINDNDNDDDDDDDDAAAATGFGQRGNIRIPRYQLCRILQQRIFSIVNDITMYRGIVYPNIELLYDHSLCTMKEVYNEDSAVTHSDSDTSGIDVDADANQKSTAKIQVTFTNGHTDIVDLVIGADGIYSTVVREWLAQVQQIQHKASKSSLSFYTEKDIENSRPLPEHQQQQQQQQQRQQIPVLVTPPLPPPQSLQVRIILGITDDLRALYVEQHELLQERGFYTLSHGHRLFVMPYTGSARNRSFRVNEPVRFMWQLSFPSQDQDECTDDAYYHRSKRYATIELKEEALQRTHQWHEPVHALIHSTNIQNIWGTMLRDRNPTDIGNLLCVTKQNPIGPENAKVQRVLVIGDALHGMSPFKGQGANQCLKDAVCVSKWLYKSGRTNASAAIQCITREIVQRTTPIVMASRTAAEYWHTINNHGTKMEQLTFAGIDDDTVRIEFLKELKRQNINAGTTRKLDDTIRKLLAQYRCPPKRAFSNIMVEIRMEVDVFHAAYEGNTGGLRKVSWNNPNLIRTLKLCRRNINECQSDDDFVKFGITNEDCSHNNDNTDSCGNVWTTALHIASIRGHVRTVHWLVTEAGCRVERSDSMGRTVLALAKLKLLENDMCDLILRLQRTAA
jgi:2-polyprenyl-6-methoxyphenol hydroxylase-like FAD-dependent oxidoreductase